MFVQQLDHTIVHVPTAVWDVLGEREKKRGLPIASWGSPKALALDEVLPEKEEKNTGQQNSEVAPVHQPRSPRCHDGKPLLWSLMTHAESH